VPSLFAHFKKFSPKIGRFTSGKTSLLPNY